MNLRNLSHIMLRIKNARNCPLEILHSFFKHCSKLKPFSNFSSPYASLSLRCMLYYYYCRPTIFILVAAVIVAIFFNYYHYWALTSIISITYIFNFRLNLVLNIHVVSYFLDTTRPRLATGVRRCKPN